MTAAEHLLELAEAVRRPRDLLLVPTQPMAEHHFARIRLALDFEALPPVVRLRAVVEEWSYLDLVREVH